MENKAEDTEIKTENVEEKLERAGAEPGDTEKLLDAEKVSGVEEKKEACAEKKSESTEEVPTLVGEASAPAGEVPASVGEASAPAGEVLAHTREAATEKAGEVLAHAGETVTEKASAKDVEKKQDGKNKINSKKIAGGVELAAAFILAVLSGWLFFNTRGTRLLYISVTTGRVSRYYWVFLAAAVIFLAIGVFTLRPRRREGKEDVKEILLERDGNASG